MKKRKLKGRVVSNKMQKTIVVEIKRLRKAPKYLKYVTTSRRLKAHAENTADYVPGDEVLIEESRPLSKEKRWKVVQLIRRTKVEAGEPQEPEPEIKEP